MSVGIAEDCSIFDLYLFVCWVTCFIDGMSSVDSKNCKMHEQMNSERYALIIIIVKIIALHSITGLRLLILVS